MGGIHDRHRRTLRLFTSQLRCFARNDVIFVSKTPLSHASIACDKGNLASGPPHSHLYLLAHRRVSHLILNITNKTFTVILGLFIGPHIMRMIAKIYHNTWHNEPTTNRGWRVCLHISADWRESGQLTVTWLLVVKWLSSQIKRSRWFWACLYIPI